jgi:hypothetical protein
VEAAVPTYPQHRGSQTKSTKAERQTGNAIIAAVKQTQLTFVPNTASQAHLKRTPAITAGMNVRARTPACGLVGIRMVIIGIPLQTWMQVIVGVDV